MRDRRPLTLRRAWSRRAESWEHQVTSSPAFSKIQKAVLDAARPGVEDQAVDLGAGTGFLTLALATRVASVLAVDLAEPMLVALKQEAAKRGLANIETLVADLATLDLRAGRADVVVSSYALHHLTDPDKLALIARARRWLRPGGRIVIADMMFGRGSTADERRIILDKVVRLARKGPGGWWRIAKNIVRFGLRRGTELPVPPNFWMAALRDAGFVDVTYHPIVAEAGVVFGRVPDGAPPASNDADESARIRLRGLRRRRP
jgi:SAM-dependent methyltransferase